MSPGHLLHILDHWGLGGAQRLISNWSLVDPGNRHSVLALFAHQARPWPLARNSSLHFLAESYSATPLLPRRLRAFLRDHQTDRVLIHLPGSRWAAHRAGLRGSIWFEHSCEDLPMRLPLLAPHLARLMRGMSRSTALVVAISAHAARYAETHWHCSAGSVPILSPPLPWQPRPRARHEGPPRLGFVGRICRQKGWRDALNCLHALRDLPWQLQVFGSGEEEAAMRARVVELNLQERIHFMGSPVLTPDHYAGLDGLLMPSQWEPFGLVALEAQASGVDVIGYAVDGLAAQLNAHAGSRAVWPADQAALTQALRQKLQAGFSQQALDLTNRNRAFLAQWEALMARTA
jgi:glycosyltransferase involved in cell wall biosynthesis